MFCATDASEPVADLGTAPLPSQDIQKDGCGVIKTHKNTLILANSDVLYISMHNNLYLPKDCTHHTP